MDSLIRHQQFYIPDSDAYLDYYVSQAGGLLPHYWASQQGFGLGSLLRSLFRSIVPFGRKVLKPVAKRAFAIAKPHLMEAAPHLKDAAKDMARAAATHIGEKIASRMTSPQEGGRRPKKRAASKRKAPAKRRRTGATSKRRPGKQKTIKQERTDFFPSIF
jgi:hypothetical protein